MKEKYYEKIGFIIFFGFALFVVDILVKRLLEAKLPEQGVYFLGKLFGLCCVHNENIAFSLPFNQDLLFFVIAIIVFYLIYNLTLYYRDNKVIGIWGSNLIIWGALANLHDRMNYGYVIDYIHLPLWPVFNLADVLVVTGVTMLVLVYVFEKKKDQQVSASQA